jgi:nucleoside-diphosphate-sugar epimerase
LERFRGLKFGFEPNLSFNLIGILTEKSGVVDRLVGDLQVDSPKANELLEWMPPYSVEQGIAETVSDFINRKV